ncbi:MAG: phosphinothricin N-acetyltransferase [Phycisphaerae bacterium]|nr:Phosphinothricin N-acetyltransferase [Phycisphaerales bacterium]MCK6477242.1 N-acetyltransferase family protein [Phycisphaerales bacterium]
MLVRDFAQQDVGAANALTNHFIEHTTVHWGQTPAADAEFARLWRSGSKTHPWLVAELDGRFAGYAKASVWRERDAYSRTAETTVYVSLDKHRRGVGRILMQALLDRLRAAGFHAAVAGIALPNDPSIRLHEALGFTYVGTFHEVGWKFGRWLDAGFWELKL